MFEQYIPGGIILDVRSPEEYQPQHVKDAINIPVQELDSKCEQLLTDKTKPINVYCLGGVRAGRAKDILIRHGYQTVVNIGGIDEALSKCPK